MMTRSELFTRTGKARTAVLCLLACLSFCLLGFFAGVSAAIELDLARDHDPRIGSDEPRTVLRFHPRLKALWLEALARPEADSKRQAADAIAHAHRLGMPGLRETIPRLVAEVEAPDAHPVVRQAVARTLIALDARQGAPITSRCARCGWPA